jgi:hypothetical protein
MRYFCNCTDDIWLTNVPENLYLLVNPNEWVCLDCLEASVYFWVPCLVDDLGIDISDTIPPENQGDSE